MQRFPWPDFSSLLKVLEKSTKKMVKAIRQVNKMQILAAVVIGFLLIGNGAFWVFRASKRNPGVAKDPELKQWEIDLGEKYMDLEEIQLSPPPTVTDQPDQASKGEGEGAQVPSPKEPPPEDKGSEIPPEEKQALPLQEPPHQEAIMAVNTQASYALATMALPTLGKVITEHSMDQLVYSKTLEQWSVHPGIDIEAEMGTAVKAAMSGVVAEVREDDPRLGVVIVLDHDGAMRTIYGNLAPGKNVKRGDRVNKGQVIGRVGQSAPYESEDPPHLHFEINLEDEAIDPLLYLPKPN